MSSVADLAKLYEASDVDRLNRRIAALEAENAELRGRIAAWVDAPLPKQHDARWLAVYGAAFAHRWTSAPMLDDEERVYVAMVNAEAIANLEREARTKGEKR